MLKGLVLRPFKEPTVEQFEDHMDMQDTVEGFFENVHLIIHNGPEANMLVNDEYLLGQFDIEEDINHLATAICIIGGRPDLQVFGPVIVFGPVRNEDLTDVHSSLITYAEQTWAKWEAMKEEANG